MLKKWKNNKSWSSITAELLLYLIAGSLSCLMSFFIFSVMFTLTRGTGFLGNFPVFNAIVILWVIACALFPIILMLL